MKKKKDVENNKPLVPLSKVSTWNGFLQESMMHYPSKGQWREQLANTLLLWAEDPDALDIQQFCLFYKMRRATLYEWAAKYPDLKKALDEARLILASRKRVGALKKQFDPSVAYKDMHKLDPEYLDINAYWSALKSGQEDKGKVFNITLPDGSKLIQEKD